MTTLSLHRYGPITIAQHKAHFQATGEFLHVFLDGVNVTRVCRFADDIRGVVELYAEIGGLNLGLYETKKGVVEILPSRDPEHPPVPQYVPNTPETMQ